MFIFGSKPISVLRIGELINKKKLRDAIIISKHVKSRLQELKL